MNIWLVNHYAVPPQYYPLARPSLFAKNLIRMGHNVTIIAASTVHNSNCLNLIEGREVVRKEEYDGIPYVLINCKTYRGNGLNRVINIIQFAKRLPRVLDELDKPEVIVATSFDPFTCYRGVMYGKKHGIKTIAEIADLWPETLVAYGGVSANNVIVRFLRWIEKKIYYTANSIVFTMEGGYDYIEEQGWENSIPLSKTHYINNGVSLEEFRYNREHFCVDDADLSDKKSFKVVYTGSIRKVNDLNLLLDAAKIIKDTDIRILIWGDGDQKEELEKRCEREKISNVKFKGRVDKVYIPYITSLADVNLFHGKETDILRFGLSGNKLFDYMASGKPTIVDFQCKYNPILEHEAGVAVNKQTPEEIATVMMDFKNMSKEMYDKYCTNAERGVKQYDFCELTKELERVMMEL